MPGRAPGSQRRSALWAAEGEGAAEWLKECPHCGEGTGQGTSLTFWRGTASAVGLTGLRRHCSEPLPQPYNVMKHPSWSPSRTACVSQWGDCISLASGDTP